MRRSCLANLSDRAGGAGSTLCRRPRAAAPHAASRHHGSLTTCLSSSSNHIAPCSRIVPTWGGSSSSSSRGDAGASRRRRCSRIAATQGGLGDEELDVAVFRFTLGIPGFDDALVPRVIGAGVAALVAVNHALGAQPPPPAQVRAEFLDVSLAALCVAAPEIEARLRQAGPGQGRAGAGQVDGAAQLFALAEGLPDAVKKELAWASFALLKNVNCCSVLLLQPGGPQGGVLLARGAVAAGAVAPGDAAGSLQRISQGLGSLLPGRGSSSSGSGGSGGLAPVLSGAQAQAWLPDRQALQAAGLGGGGVVPEGAQSALLQAAPGGSLLLVLAERPRALSDKDRKWVAAIAAKLGEALQ